MANVRVQHFYLYKLQNSKLTNANILCLVWFGSEQTSVVTNSVPEQWRPDRMITVIYLHMPAMQGDRLASKLRFNASITHSHQNVRTSGLVNGTIITPL